MNNRNLIPTKRLAAKRRQRAVRRWIVLDGLCLCVVVGVGLACFYKGMATTSRMADAPAAAEIEKSNATFVSLRQESARVHADWQSVLELSDGPDWSVLLSALAGSLGDDVVMNGVDCTAAPTAGMTVADGVHQLRIGGLARSQAAVTQFVLRVEDMHFFSHVQLVQTAPQSLRGTPCVSFRLVCTWADASGAK